MRELLKGTDKPRFITLGEGPDRHVVPLGPDGKLHGAPPEHVRAKIEAGTKDPGKKAAWAARRAEPDYTPHAEKLVTRAREHGNSLTPEQAFGKPHFLVRRGRDPQTGQLLIDRVDRKRNWPFEEVPWDAKFGLEHDDRFEPDPHREGAYHVKGAPTLHDRPWELTQSEHFNALSQYNMERDRALWDPKSAESSADWDHTAARDRVASLLNTAASYSWNVPPELKKDTDAYDVAWDRAHGSGKFKGKEPPPDAEEKLGATRARLAAQAQKLLGTPAGDALFRHVGVREMYDALDRYTETAQTHAEAKNALDKLTAQWPEKQNWHATVRGALERGEALPYETAKALWPEHKYTHGHSPSFKSFLDVHAQHPADATQNVSVRKRTIGQGHDFAVDFQQPHGSWTEIVVPEGDERYTMTEDEARAKAQQQIRDRAQVKPAAVPDYFAQQHPEHAEALKGLLRVEGQADDPAVRGGVEALAKFPPKLLKALRDHGGNGIHIGNVNTPDLNDLGHLRDIKREATSWDDRATWDEIGGVYSHGHKVAATGTLQEQMSPERAAHVTLHEVGHALGDNLGLNDHPELIAAHTRLAKGQRLVPYLHRTGEGDDIGRRELLAEGFAHLLGHGPAHAASLYDRAYVRFLQRHIAHYGGPAVPTATPADLPFDEYATEERKTVAHKLLSDRARKLDVQLAQNAVTEAEEQLTRHQQAARDDSWSWDESQKERHAKTLQNSESELKHFQKELRDAKKHEYTAAYLGVTGALQGAHNSWARLADLETGETPIGDEDDRETLRAWAKRVEEKYVDPELHARLKKFMKAHKI